MKLTEALHYAKEIIKRGKKKGYSVIDVKRSIIDYAEILKDEGSISANDEKVLIEVANKVADIMADKTTVDKVSIDYLAEQTEKNKKPSKPRQKVKTLEVNKPSVIVACGSSVQRDRCGNIISSGCGSSSSSSSISRCGSSSSSSCGYGGSSRC